MREIRASVNYSLTEYKWFIPINEATQPRASPPSLHEFKLESNS